MVIGLLWMIYDLINAPEVDDDENFINPSDYNSKEDAREAPNATETKKEKKISKID
jgi:hypothetical protein